MYPQSAGLSAQKPETFMLSTEAQQALPHDAQVALQQVDNLKYFLLSAPVDWQHDNYIRRFLLPTGEYVSCVLWNNLFHITGTDIVRCLSFRFQAFGRPVKNSKKFEEGIFSDLRNLKSGTDASLEEPKSAFLDFLYKNNCIRTQKKQKVFYWYSVHHDRLFLDALERDLKREKMNQEATTVAVSEPAVSFQYDSSQSLFEQLTKSQQADPSSINAQQPSFSQSQSTSPVMRAMDSMPPPSMIPQTMPPLAEGMDAMMSFGTMSATSVPAPPIAQQVAAIKREPDFSRVHYNQHGVPISATHQRHASMPAYGLEYSPAPSFVSSQFEDYSNRGISFEPMTPPQQALGIPSEPAYIASDESGLYSTTSDNMGSAHHLTGLSNLHATMGSQQLPRSTASHHVYSAIEGSPTYKQRRRRSSLTQSMSAGQAPTTNPGSHTYTHVRRPSELRRSVSASAGLVGEDDEVDNSSQGLSFSASGVVIANSTHRETMNLSRHVTPLTTIEGSPVIGSMTYGQEFPQLKAVDDLGALGMPEHRRNQSHATGPVRRARSATVMELGPYPQKSHSCPIPTCGRLFKRLEHLKRHVRTHTQEKPYMCPHCNKAFSRSDNLAQHKRTHSREEGGEGIALSGEEEEEFSGDDQLGPLEEASPISELVFGGPMTTSGSLQQTQPINNMRSMGIPMSLGHVNPMY